MPPRDGIGTDHSEDQLRLSLTKMREARARAPVPTATERIDRLDRLHRAILAYKGRLALAIDEDLAGRVAADSVVSELLPVIEGIRYNQEEVRKWTKKSRRRKPLTLFGAHTKATYQPLGVIGVLVPRNSPIFLSLSPLVGALAAGNSAMIKTSELAPKTGALIETMIADHFCEDEAVIVNGGTDVTTAFTKLPFDHLVFGGIAAPGLQTETPGLASGLSYPLGEIGHAPDILFDFDHVDTIEARALANGWDLRFSPLEKGRFVGRYRFWQGPGVSLTHKIFGRRAGLIGLAPTGWISLVLPSGASGSVVSRGVRMTPNSLMIVAPGECLQLVTPAEVELASIQIDQAAFDQMAGILFPGAAVGSRIETRVKSVPPRLMAKLRDVLSPSSADGGEQEAWHEGAWGRPRLTSTLTAWAVIAVVTERAPRGSLRDGVMSQSARVARSARDFLEANLCRRVTRAEVSAVTGVPIRTLQHCFEDLYGISPIAYHRFRRLKEAHSMLKDGHPLSLTVTQVATSWGFDHLGRFAADYKSVFGVPPSVTLARR